MLREEEYKSSKGLLLYILPVSSNPHTSCYDHRPIRCGITESEGKQQIGLRFIEPINFTAHPSITN